MRRPCRPCRRARHPSVEECLAFARAAGFRCVTLWTNGVLVSARRIYQNLGFTLVDEETHHGFGHDLVGRNPVLDLAAG